jgi:hypothetical protein
MGEFSVPTIPLSVEVWCDDGRRFVGDVFMPARSALHDGQMGPEEWVNSIAGFFPFRSYDGRVRAVLNRRQVVAISVPSSAASPDDEAAGSPVYEVEVEAGGRQFRGRMVADRPSYQQRVVDLLNGPDPFVALHGDERHHLVHKAHITRVLELGEP